MNPPVLYWSLSIIPVQSWIGEARRSRDLRVGSTVLSWLAGRALNRLRAHGADILLPRLEPSLLEPMDGSFAAALGRRSVAIPNRASGHLPASALPHEIFKGLEEGLREDWSALVDEVSDSARRSARELWSTVGEFVEAASCPLGLVWCAEQDGSRDTSLWHGLERADRMLAAVKRTRPVSVHHGGPVRKCGQCGRREALGGGKGHDPRRWRRTQEAVAQLEEVRRAARSAARPQTIREGSAGGPGAGREGGGSAAGRATPQSAGHQADQHGSGVRGPDGPGGGMGGDRR